jgi:predicted metal-dependent hydrolase
VTGPRVARSVSEQRVLADGRPLEFKLVRSSARKRTLAISVDLSGGVRVLAPARAPLVEIRDFVAGRAAWIEKRRTAIADAVAQRVDCASDDRVPYLDTELRLVVRCAAFEKAGTARKGDELHVIVPPIADEAAAQRTIRSAVLHWYREEANQLLPAAIERWTPHVGRKPVRVEVRDTKTQWGSCSPDDVIRMNFRLVMMPQRLIDYVAVHELAHLVHHNHGSAYWGLVASVLPDHRERRAELRQLGRSLAL